VGKDEKEAVSRIDFVFFNLVRKDLTTGFKILKYFLSFA